MAKLYFDGASRGNPGLAASACVLVSDTIGTKTNAKYIGHKTNNYAEYRALIMGLHLALNTSHSELQVFGDSLLVINQVTGKWRVRHPSMLELWTETMTLVKQFNHISLTFIPRKKNKVADRAANVALDKHLRLLKSSEQHDSAPSMTHC